MMRLEYLKAATLGSSPVAALILWVTLFGAVITAAGRRLEG